MNYLWVKDWAKHQHYTKRDPIWIKLYRKILDDHAFSSLTDAQKGQLLMIWVLASTDQGRIPNDARFIASRINASSKVNLQVFIEAGFLTTEQSLVKPSAKDSALAKMRELTASMVK